MKKINYGLFVCEVSVDPDYMLLKHGLCDYERDTIAYAVERFLPAAEKPVRHARKKVYRFVLPKAKQKESTHLCILHRQF